MTRFLKTAGSIVLFGMIAATSRVQATEPDRDVKEGHAVVTALGTEASAITYWVSQPNGWQVVTTVGTTDADSIDTKNRSVVRFSAVLLPGQSQSISVPVAIGEAQPVLLIRRVGDRIEVNTDPTLEN